MLYIRVSDNADAIGGRDWPSGDRLLGLCRQWWRCYSHQIITSGAISITGVKHLPALLAKNCSDDPHLRTFSVEPLVIYNCAL